MAVIKNKVDWMAMEMGSIRPCQGRTLAVMQVCGGSQSFNVVNTLRLLRRWILMFTIPNQSSVLMVYKEFNDEGRVGPSGYYERVVDVMEELFKMTLLLRGRTDYQNDRYSERTERAVRALNAIEENLVIHPKKSRNADLELCQIGMARSQISYRRGHSRSAILPLSNA